MKAEFKRLDERTIDRVLCYSRRRAAKYLGVDGTTLDSWKDYCALLGRALPTRLLPTVLNRKIDYFEKGALDEVLEAKTRLEDIPNVPRYIYIEDAMKALSCSLKTVRNKLRTAGMKARKELGKGKDGHPRRLTFIPRSLDPRLELRATPNNSTSTSNLGQKRGRGRQRGWRDEQAIERDRKMIAAWETGEYDSASELGREFRVDPSYARKLIRSITRAGK